MKKFSLLRNLLLTTALATFAVSAASAQQLVVNGGFEMGNFSGWTMTDPDGFTNVGNNVNFAHSGTHFANLGAETTPGFLSQVINTIPGATYQFSFALANDVTPPAGANFFQASWGGTPVLTLQNEPAFGYNVYSYQVVASGPTTTIQFQYQHMDDFWRLDSVSVVPEPSTVALLGFGAIGAFLAVRRARRKA